MTPTGLKDKHGKEIHEGDFVSLAGYTTADDTMGHLPSGWIFIDDDIYEVWRDPSIDNWSLKLGGGA